MFMDYFIDKMISKIKIMGYIRITVFLSCKSVKLKNIMENGSYVNSTSMLSQLGLICISNLELY